MVQCCCRAVILQIKKILFPLRMGPRHVWICLKLTS